MKRTRKHQTIFTAGLATLLALPAATVMAQGDDYESATDIDPRAAKEATDDDLTPGNPDDPLRQGGVATPQRGAQPAVRPQPGLNQAELDRAMPPQQATIRPVYERDAQGRPMFRDAAGQTFVYTGGTWMAMMDRTRRAGQAASQSRPKLGIGLQDTQDGIRVISVLNGSPAAQAGLQPGDVILKANGQAVNNTQAFVDRIQAMQAGEEVAFTVARGDQQQDLTATLQSTQPSPSGDRQRVAKPAISDSARSMSDQELRQQIDQLQQELDRRQQQADADSGQEQASDQTQAGGQEKSDQASSSGDADAPAKAEADEAEAKLNQQDDAAAEAQEADESAKSAAESAAETAGNAAESAGEAAESATESSLD